MTNKKKGFIFSLEAMFALMIASILVGGILIMTYYIDDTGTKKDTLIFVANDFLDVLDQSNLALNNSATQNYINGFTSQTYCFRYDVLGEDNILRHSYMKLGCDLPNSDYYLTRRTYVENNEFYTLRLYAWYN